MIILEFISCWWMSRFCLIVMSRIFRSIKALTSAITSAVLTPQPAKLGDDQGVGFIKDLHQFVDSALLAGLAR
jgi:hypothetical protein